MEHSTHTLYISDDSDNESNASELQELGKENISPTRLAEIMAIEPSERANIMRVDPPEKALPRRHRGREPLREMQKEELTPPTAALDSAPETFKTPKLGDETYAAFFTTPKKNSKKVLDEDEQQEELASTPKSPSTPGWVVFESDHEGDDSDGGGLDSEEDAAKVPLPLNDDPFELGEDPRFVDFSDSVGSVSEEEDEDY